MLDATDLKSKVDAVVTAGNAVLALKANPASTLAASVTAVQAARNIVDEMNVAIQEFSSQRDSQAVLNLE